MTPRPRQQDQRRRQHSGSPEHTPIPRGHHSGSVATARPGHQAAINGPAPTAIRSRNAQHTQPGSADPVVGMGRQCASPLRERASGWRSSLVVRLWVFVSRGSAEARTGRRPAFRPFSALRLGFRGRGVPRAALDPPSSTRQVNLGGSAQAGGLGGLGRGGGSGVQGEQIGGLGGEAGRAEGVGGRGGRDWEAGGEEVAGGRAVLAGRASVGL
jgi:hypothetical protein